MIASVLSSAVSTSYILRMCGRTTKNYTWEQIHALYQLAVPAAIPQPSFNLCPTDPVDTVLAHEGKRELVQMRSKASPSSENPLSSVAEVHDRMPVLLMPEHFDAWLSGAMSAAD